MTKKITLIALLMLLIGAMSYGQTGSLATVTASPGEAVVVPLTVGSWINTGAITLNIKFKPNYLSFTSLTSPAAGLTGYNVNSNDSMVMFSWAKTPGVNFNGVLFNLNFIYNGATSTPLNFLSSCQVTDANAVVMNVTWTDGAVNAQTGNAQKATLTAPTGTTGYSLPVLLKFEGFASNIAAITQKIHYDPSQLSFVNIVTVGTLSGAIANALNGVVTITWTNTAGANINLISGNSITLNFVYNGGLCTPVTFDPGCIITDKLFNNVAVSYMNGMVCPGAAVGTAVLGTITGAVQGQDYDVPLTFNTLPGISSFTLQITYDSPRLSYIGVNSIMPTVPPGQTMVNVNGNKITIVYTNAAAPSINGPTPFLKLKFKYNGVGTAIVGFGNGCFFTDPLVVAVQVGYTNGSISPVVATANATIGCDNGTVGNEVDLPVTFASLPPAMGAVTLFIGFDPSMLTYIGVSGNTFGASNWSPSPGQVNIAWASATSTNLNGIFLTLRFIYNGGGGGGGAAPVFFKDGCELDDHTATIVPVNWNNGGVNLGFKVSGILAYNSAPNPDIPLTSVTVYLKKNPGAVLVSSTTTNGSGYFEFLGVLNGTYYLDASTSKAWGGGTTLDASYIFYKAIYSIPFPSENALRLKAADVDLDLAITTLDASYVFYKAIYGIPYAAPDWLFEAPAFNVNCADVNNVNFYGLCSGDVDGSYSPIP